jgi:hypothetical protein
MEAKEGGRENRWDDLSIAKGSDQGFRFGGGINLGGA